MGSFFIDFADSAFPISGGLAGGGGDAAALAWLEVDCLAFCSFVTSFDRHHNPAREA